MCLWHVHVRAFVMFARLVLVAFFLIGCTPGCHGEGVDDECVDYEYESPDFGECTLDLLGDFQERNAIGSKECCVGGHPYMTTAKFWDFLTPSPLCPHLGLIYSTKFTQPPLLHLILG